MKKVARWAWRSAPPGRGEMPSVASLAVSDVGGKGGATGAVRGRGEGAKEGTPGGRGVGVGVGPVGGGGGAGGLTKSRSQRGQGRAAGGEPTGGVGFLQEGRRSVSQVEACAAGAAAALHVKVVEADMPEFMQVHAFRCARRSYDGLHKFSSKQMAHDIKKEFDKVYGPVWHCIIGSSFGSFVTHSTGCFLCFSMEKLLVLVFKTTIRRAST